MRRTRLSSKRVAGGVEVKLGREWSSDACACGVTYIRTVRTPVSGLRSLCYGTSTADASSRGPRGEGYALGEATRPPVMSNLTHVIELLKVPYACRLR